MTRDDLLDRELGVVGCLGVRTLGLCSPLRDGVRGVLTGLDILQLSNLKLLFYY